MLSNAHRTQDLPLSAGPGRVILRVERREWWLWSSAVLIALTLTTGIASFLLPSMLAPGRTSTTLSADEVVGGLSALVFLFALYVAYEQHQINIIRRRVTEQLYRLSVLDPLTGLYNRRHIEQKLADEISRSERHGHPLTVILFDLNGFKQVNDTHGHPSGDAVLQAFADRLRKATRGSDAAGRYGGDEFLVVLPECRKEGVQYVFNRLKDLEVEVGETKLLVRYSAGSADFARGQTLIELLKRADTALYSNKRRPVNSPTPFPGSTGAHTATPVRGSDED